METFLIKREEPLNVKKRRPGRHPSRSRMLETWLEEEQLKTLSDAAGAVVDATTCPAAGTAAETPGRNPDHLASRPSIDAASTCTGDALNADEEMTGAEWSPEIPFENVTIN